MLSPEHEALRHLILSPGWELYCRMLGEKQKELLAGWMESKEPSDQYTRGYIKALIYCATWPQKEVDVAEQRDAEDKEDVDKNLEYEHIAAHGYSYPIGDHPQGGLNGRD